MELLIVRDRTRYSVDLRPYRQYEEEGIKTTVCNSDTLCHLPSMAFDIVVVDLVKETLEGGDLEFLSHLRSQAYRGILAIGDPCSREKEVKEILRNAGIEEYLRRPLSKELFFRSVDEVLRESKKREN